ncbi:hypothetical protein D3C77_544450 [compost metagenome]
MQERQVRSRRIEVDSSACATEPPGQCRAGEPQQQNRRGEDQHQRFERQQAYEQQRKRGCDPQAAVQTIQVVDTGALDFARRAPLQQPPLADKHTPEGAGDRIQAVIGFEGQPRQRKTGAKKVQARTAQYRCKMLVQGHLKGSCA